MIRTSISTLCFKAEATHTAGAMTTGELGELKETMTEKANEVQQRPGLDDDSGL
jgi:hypothetical protein